MKDPKNKRKTTRTTSRRHRLNLNPRLARLAQEVAAFQRRTKRIVLQYNEKIITVKIDNECYTVIFNSCARGMHAS